MALEITHTPPLLADFMLLAEHQQTTPGTFFGGKPVLHLHSPNAKIRISREDLQSQPALSNLQVEQSTSESGTQDQEVVIEEIDVWVSSSLLTLFSNSRSIGVQIPYQTITVHAQDGDAVLLGLSPSDANTADEDITFTQLRIIPTEIETHEQSVEDGHPQQTNGNTTHSATPSEAVFKAIADCQELNPDPPEEGDEDFDETAPGATGWITSENMGDFLDANGELRIPQGATVIGGEGEEEGVDGLSAGAGRTRTAAELDTEDGAEEETKWQRTG